MLKYDSVHHFTCDSDKNYFTEMSSFHLNVHSFYLINEAKKT